MPFWATFTLVCGGLAAFVGIVAQIAKAVAVFWRMAIARMEQKLQEISDDVKAVKAVIDLQGQRITRNEDDIREIKTEMGKLEQQITRLQWQQPGPGRPPQRRQRQ